MSDDRLDMNAAMAALRPVLTERPGLLAPELAEVVAEGFEDRDGLVLLRLYAASAQNVTDREDAVGVEAFVNHIHIEDIVGARSREEMLVQTWAYAAALAAALRDTHPHDEFELSVAVSDSYTVRFHRVWPGVGWLAADLDGYESEAMLRLHILPAPA